MLFTVNVKALNGTGWQVDVLDPRTGGALLEQPRTLSSVTVSGNRFPLPPDGGPDELPADLQPDDLEDALQKVMNQSAGSVGVERFGRYLFSTLIGTDLWTEIDQAAGASPIELALTWPRGDSTFDRLPWELMHSGDQDPARPYAGFLAGKPEVAITRRVAGTTDAATYQLQSLRSPLRVLFVIGSSLADPVIRPGAEYVGLLRYLSQRGLDIFPKPLLNATTEQLSDAVRDFQPSVVHVICHGQLAESGPSLLFRKPDSDDTDPVNAQRLRDAIALKLEPGTPLPRVLVLNACSTAAADELRIGRPMAAEMVERGFPIVVGMSGNVADQACRLFTRNFYEALLQGDNVALAAARGRRAAIAQSNYDPRAQVDWALPALFLAQAPGEVTVKAQGVDVEAERLQWAREFTKRPDYPVFCGRWDVFAAYERLMTSDVHQSLAISVPRSDDTDPLHPQPQFGSSRVLNELAAQAMRDGHLPILVSRDWFSLERWPSELNVFVDKFTEATRMAIDILSNVTSHAKLLDEWSWQKLDVVRDVLHQRADPKSLPNDLKGLPDEAMVARAVIQDLLELRRVFCRQSGLAEESGIKLLLLVEDFHQLLFGDLFIIALERYGLRVGRAVKDVRLVLTYNETATDAQVSTVKEIGKWAQSNDVFPLRLGSLHPPFNTERPDVQSESFQQARLVYRSFLLAWRKDDQAMPLSLVESGFIPTLVSGLADATRSGIPSELCKQGADLVINMGRGINALRPADDDAALEGLNKDLPRRTAK